MLPVGPGIVAADRLALTEQGRDRLAERPGELAVRGSLAFIDLGALGVDAEHDGLAGCGNGVRKRLRWAGCPDRGRKQQAGDGELDGHDRSPHLGVKTKGPRLKARPLMMSDRSRAKMRMPLTSP